VPADPYTLGREVERLVGEDRVPTEVLERLCAEYGGVGTASWPPREPSLPRRSAAIFSGAVRRLARRARGTSTETPTAFCLDGADAIEVLFNAAYDSELAMLDELVERAGLGWKCRAEVAGSPCHYMNVGTTSCGGCGADEQQGKEEPDG
jgi:hypothetical protein